MEPDYRALEKKEIELKDLAIKLCSNQISDQPKNIDKYIDKLFGSVIQLSPPLEPPLVMECILLSSMGSRGGRSRKPGNIKLNFGNLVELVPDIALTAAGAAGSSWLLPFAALSIWNKLWSKANIELSQKHAVTIYALWKNRNHENKISEESGYKKAVSIFEALEIAAPSNREYTNIISDLSDMKCIELEGGIIWLREWVKTTY